MTLLYTDEVAKTSFENKIPEQKSEETWHCIQDFISIRLNTDMKVPGFPLMLS